MISSRKTSKLILEPERNDTHLEVLPSSVICAWQLSAKVTVCRCQRSFVCDVGKVEFSAILEVR